MITDSSIAGVILSGGRSSRMGGVIKSHQMLNGRPLLQHVIDRVAPQVGTLVLSVEQVHGDYDRYGLEQVADLRSGSHGPLGGLLAALSHFAGSKEWLLLTPCDAPFLPRDLAMRLKSRAEETGGAGCLVRYGSEIQPTFSIWSRRLLPSLQRAVEEQGMGGFKQFLEVQPLTLLDWDEAGFSPFFNINDPASLAVAQELLEQEITLSKPLKTP